MCVVFLLMPKNDEGFCYTYIIPDDEYVLS